MSKEHTRSASPLAEPEDKEPQQLHIYSASVFTNPYQMRALETFLKEKMSKEDRDSIWQNHI